MNKIVLNQQGGFCVNRETATQESKSKLLVKAVGISVLLGAACIAVLLLLFSIVMVTNDVPAFAIDICTSVSLGLGTLLAGYLAARILRSNGIVVGAVTAAVLFAVLFFISLIFVYRAITIVMLTKFAICLICGIIGGILGVNHKSKKR